MTGKHDTPIPTSTKRLSRIRKRLTKTSDWAVTAVLNMLWEKSTDRSLLAIQEEKDKLNA
jgi:hypothetical protein